MLLQLEPLKGVENTHLDTVDIKQELNDPEVMNEVNQMEQEIEVQNFWGKNLKQKVQKQNWSLLPVIFVDSHHKQCKM